MMINIKQSLKLLVCSLFLLQAGCSNDNNDLQTYMYKIKHRPAKPIEPIPKFAPLPKFKFPEDEVRRNPFKPIEMRKVVDELAPDKNRKKQFLESFPLDALNFVGTLKEGKVMWALIKQPKGTISRVTIGNYMGQNYGRVLLIKDDSIKLEETVKDSGKWAKHITIINLSTPK